MMKRRDFLKAVAVAPAVCAVPALAASPEPLIPMETPEQAYHAWLEAEEWVRAMRWYARNGASVAV